jgi:hypothetical protein
VTSDFLLVNLRAVGVFMAALVVFNVFVPRHLHWPEDLRRLSLVNRQIFEVHAIFLVLILAMFAVLLLTSSDALLQPSRLSRLLLGGLTIFWGLRMLAQWFYYSPATWRGDRMRTAVHYGFSAAWIYVTSVFAAAFGWVTLLR